MLNWSTGSEINNSGFEVQRKTGNADWTKCWVRITVDGTSNVQENYSFADNNLQSGKYKYRLKQLDYQRKL